MNTNDIVVFVSPTEDEICNGEPLRFIVREANGDRCLIEPVTSSLYYKPLQTVLTSDLITVDEYENSKSISGM